MIQTTDGESYRFDVELAVSAQQKAQGLMFREKMGAREGMLFIFSEEVLRSFWMKNTVLPLDLIFIDRFGYIVSISRNVVPFDETPIPSGVPAQGVLEVLAGTVEELSLDVGDRIVHDAFEP